MEIEINFIAESFLILSAIKMIEKVCSGFLGICCLHQNTL